eukprot:GHVQ01033221.1.p1 GENE.GHVQ01033221.1~~GHVQ01033221.1.p1  ORF type:complete len:359 (+),score=38.50 GHVQ01033221.1:64-1140(+)
MLPTVYYRYSWFVLATVMCHHPHETVLLGLLLPGSGESTAPGRHPPSQEEELQRVTPVVEALREALSIIHRSSSQNVFAGSASIEEGLAEKCDSTRVVSEAEWSGVGSKRCEWQTGGGEGRDGGVGWMARLVTEYRDLPNRRPGRVLISVDTRRPCVLAAAVSSGADMLNHVSAVNNREMYETVKQLGISGIFQHSRGNSQTMATLTAYSDVVRDVAESLSDTIESLMLLSIPRWRIMADVGLGFAKKPEHCFTLLRELDLVESLLPVGIPQCVGFSQKSFIGVGVGDNLPTPIARRDSIKQNREVSTGRLYGGLAVVTWCTQKRSVLVLRTHDVSAARCARDMTLQIALPPKERTSQ